MSVPMQDREWLRQLRLLKNLTVYQMQELCDVSHVTYKSVESGGRRSSRKATVKTVSAIATGLGIKMDLFFYPTDEQGRLVDRGAVVDILALFSSKNLKAAIHSENILRLVFAPEVADFVIESVTANMAK